MGFEFFMMADKLAKLKDAQDKSQTETKYLKDMGIPSLSHSERMAAALDAAIKEEMLDEQTPFVRFVEPIPFPKEYVDELNKIYERAERLIGQQNTNGSN